MPGESGVTVVTMLVCLFHFCTRGCGCIGHPAFPTPSDFMGENSCTARAHHAAGMRSRVSSALWKFNRRTKTMSSRPSQRVARMRARWQAPREPGPI